MEKNLSKTNYLVSSGLIAAIYAALTYGLAPMSYGPIQFRISEALTILPVFTPAAIPGLAIGCLISNISSPYGTIDIIFGTLATLLAAIAVRLLRNVKIKGFPILAPLMPVIFNAIIIGAEIAFLDFAKGARLSGFFIVGLQVGAGELVVCYILGLILFKAIDASPLKKMLER